MHGLRPGLKRLLAAALWLTAGAAGAGERLLTWNVWADNPSGLQGRYPRILQRLDALAPDTACLQEVTPALLRQLQQHFHSRYFIYTDDRDGQDYGTVILSRRSGVIDRITLPTRLGRSGLVLTTRTRTLVNLHLESGLFDRDLREQQLKTLLAATRSSPNLVLCGDFNFGDHDPEQQGLAGLDDPARHHPVLTYDRERNPLAEQNAFPFEKSRRLDRLLFRPPVTPARIRVIAAPESDHYPVMVELP